MSAPPQTASVAAPAGRSTEVSGAYVIPSHRLEAPTVLDFRDTVRRVTGAGFEATWQQVCTQAGVPPGVFHLDRVPLGDLAAAIATCPGVLGVLGRSLAVRVHTYRTLSTLNGATP